MMRTDFGHSMGDPYRTFESYLRKYLPAVGFPFNGYGFPDTPDQEVSLVCVCVCVCVCTHGLYSAHMIGMCVHRTP